MAQLSENCTLHLMAIISKGYEKSLVQRLLIDTKRCSLSDGQETEDGKFIIVYATIGHKPEYFYHNFTEQEYTNNIIQKHQ